MITTTKQFENADLWDQLRMVAKALGYHDIKLTDRRGLWGRAPDRDENARPVRVARFTGGDAIYALELFRQKNGDGWDISRGQDGKSYYVTVGGRSASHRLLGIAVCVAILRHADLIK